MANSSLKHGLTAVYRRAHGKKIHTGWNKKVNGRPRWICSSAIAPTADLADDYYQKNFAELWDTSSPAPDSSGVTIADVADRFMDRSRRRKLNVRTLGEYGEAIQDFLDIVGDDRKPGELAPGDFSRVRTIFASRFGPNRLTKFIVIVRTMMKWARKPPLRLQEPDYGDEFNQPRRLEIKRHKNANRRKHGLKMFEADEVAKLLAGATPKMRAMILLGLNGGLGNTDIAEFPLSLIDLATRVVDYARGKTANDRRFVLWPETINALKIVIELRAKAFTKWKDDGRAVAPETSGLLFVTRQGRPYISDTMSQSEDPKLLHKDRIASEFSKLCASMGLAQRGRGFYSLRRTFRTIADEVDDRRVADFIMGHDSGDMGGLYVQRISNERIKKVTDYVRSKLIAVESAAVQGPISPAPKASKGAGLKRARRA